MQELNIQTTPLLGRHLIEASAGTGKTFNITRLYLRFLLERKLTVQEILVMTFTKDATEEIKGRIDSFLRETLSQWHKLIEEDPYFIELSKSVDSSEAIILLKRALLYLDEASIFTIHGFCKSVLSQHAFSTGVDFSAQMETDGQEFVIQATRDWYRGIASDDVKRFTLLAEFWPTPESFLKNFSTAIYRNCVLTRLTEEEVLSSFQYLAKQAHSELISHQALLTEALIDVKKGKDRELRQTEFNQLVSWLEQAFADESACHVKIPLNFIDGKRFSRSSFKTQLVEIFAPLKQLKTLQEKLAKNLNRAKAYEVVFDGIQKIKMLVEAQKDQSSVLSFDDLITTLNKNLNEKLGDELSERSKSLALQLFKQYPVALVDEFQDTDTQQFEILRAIYYPQPSASLFMIGDPKQAIYGFRGGDVFAYLSAREDCQHKWLMNTNWRSSANMIQAYNRLFYGNSLEKEAKEVFGYGIPYQPVNASPNAKVARFDNEFEQALHFVHFERQEDGKPNPQSFRPVIAHWCAQEIHRLLTQQDSALKAQDCAVLVRDTTEANEIKGALDNLGLSSVFLSTRANLFHSPQAEQLLGILKSILFVEDTRTFIAGLSSPLLGIAPVQLYKLQQDDFAWQEISADFSVLRDDWIKNGFIGMALKLLHNHIKLDAEIKDRELTNLLHLFELLQAASQRYQQPQELLYWYEQQIQSDTGEVEAELRLESDDNLIRIVTQHGSKGLEYPVVFVPFATRYKNPLKFGNTNVSLIEYHNEGNELVLSLGGTEEQKQRMANEAYAESIRLLYVAVTRAEQRCYICTTPFDDFDNSPLGRTLHWQKETDLLNNLIEVAADCSDAIIVRNGLEAQNDGISLQMKTEDKTPTVAKFSGKIERDWWLSSFSAMNRNLRHQGVSGPDRDTNLIEVQRSEPTAEPISELRFELVKGSHTGNFLHDIFEHLCFESPNWELAFEKPIAKFSEKNIDKEELKRWLNSALKASMGNNESEPDTFSLNDVLSAKTYRESEFYFPMNTANSASLTQLLSEHRKRISNSQTGSRQVMRLLEYKKLKGMMHGFIDLIFEYNGKYYVCDYKSSHLGDNYDCYGQMQMKENIEKNHYDLQYFIYALALHRQLKFSLPDYDPQKHFGGVYYLYLRGMSENKEHDGKGVYFQNLTLSELTTLDNIFVGESVDAGCH